MDISTPSLSLPLSLPPLPERLGIAGNWSAEIQTAYEIVQRTYNYALRVLRADGADPTRIAFHIDALSTTALPILEALIPDLDGDDSTSLPAEWLVNVATILGCMVSNLECLGKTVNEQ